MKITIDQLSFEAGYRAGAAQDTGPVRTSPDAHSAYLEPYDIHSWCLGYLEGKRADQDKAK